MKRLDQDLSRFTIELEADTGGITEILEQSVLMKTYVNHHALVCAVYYVYRVSYRIFS